MTLSDHFLNLARATTTAPALSADPSALTAVPVPDPATAYAAMLAAGAMFLRSLGATDEGGAEEQRDIANMLVNGGFTPPQNMSDAPARVLGQLILDDLVQRERNLTEAANAYAEAAANAEARGDTSDATYCRACEAEYRAMI
jgi:hypothetical protein